MNLTIAFKQNDEKLSINFKKIDERLSINFGEVYNVSDGANVSIYDGDYTVTPSANEQILETAQKKMDKNVTIIAIPYSEVTNNSGGLTVSIG